jgi:hypothetical protein
MTVIDMPPGSPLAQVVYTINHQGWITAIGSLANQSQIASYTYTAEGDLQMETLGGAWTRSIQYYSPRWIQQSSTASSDGGQSLTLAYTYHADGTPAGRQITYNFAALSGEVAETYQYDGQGRVQKATNNSNNPDGSYLYDPNGNIWSTVEGGTASFSYSPGTNHLSQAIIGGQTNLVSYDARGRMTAKRRAGPSRMTTPRI